MDGSTITYSAQGTMYLRTGAIGTEIALQVAGRTPFTVKTTTAGWHQLGELQGIGGKFGLSLAPVADQIRQTFGLDVSNVALAAGWTIKTGAQIKEAYQGYTQREIVQLLDGVPYLVYGQAGRLRLQFGQVSVATTDQAKTVLIADPADPFLYVGYKNYAAAGSVHGRIPFNTDVAPPADGGPVLGHGNDYFGHVYAAGSFPVSGLPATVNGDVTVDLDANRDGMFLGGAGNANDLFRGNLGAIDGVLRDIQVGVNGSVDLGYTVAGVAVRVPVGEASVFYSGPKGGVWFEGAQGSAMNPWAGTVLAKFRSGPGTKVAGYVMRDGTFSVATTSNYRLFAANAALTLTVTNTSIGAQGTVTTPIGKADVTGTIGFNGNFHWVAGASINVGGSANYLRGAGTMTFDRTGSVFTVTTAVDARARLAIPGFKAEGDVTGTLKITFKPDGTVAYSGSLKFDGGIYAREPITGDWNKIGSVDVGLGLSGKKLTLKAFGKTFAMTLPG